MQNTKEKNVKRISYLTAAVFMAAFICILAISALFTDTVYGEENAVLKVINGSETVNFYLEGDSQSGNDLKLYTRDSLGNKNFVQNYENGKRLKYSSINDVGTVSIPDKAEAYGPEIKEILKAAGVDISKLNGKSITFNGDGYKKTLNWSELITERYFCPNATSNFGKAVSDDPDKTIVPVIIDFNNYFKTNGSINNGGTLRIGQASPNDHNEPVFVKFMACAKGTAEAPVAGIIKINDKSTGAWKNDVEPQNGLVVKPGEELDFVYGNQSDRDLGIGHGYVFYALGENDVTLLSAIYNYNPKFETEFTGPNAPEEYGDFTVKTRIMGLGRMNSPVRTYKYTVADADISEVSDKAKLSCNSYTYNGKAKKPSVLIDGLKCGSDYNVSYSSNIKCGKVKATVKGIVPSYGGSFSKTFIIKPAAAKVTGLKCMKKKKLKVTVKNQKSSGITGYELSYKVVGKKIWKKANIPASKNLYTINKLKKGKRYYVKVRAYKTIDGKKVFGKISNSKKSKKIR